MTATLTPTAPRTTKPAARLCWWCCSKQEAREKIEAAMSVRCGIEEKGVTTYFWIAPHAPRPGVWTMTKETPDGSEGVMYVVECGDCADALDFRCNHAQVNGFHGRPVFGCRHSLALVALLRSINLVP